jgi:D-alanine-D-alanine ligase
MKIAVVRNRKNKGVMSQLNHPSAERYGRRSVQNVMDALRAGGHTVKVVEGDMTMLKKLQKFIPPDEETGLPTGMVFNMSYGIQGEGRYEHVPVLLEMAGIPYTGPGPRSHAISLDKVVTKLLIEKEGVPTPRFRTTRNLDGIVNGLRFPLVVKPRHESTSNGLALVHDEQSLEQAIDLIVTDYNQDALIEEYIDGRELAVGLIGNNPTEILPIVEIDFGDRPIKMMTRADKFHKTEDEPGKICPALLSQERVEELHKIAIAVYNICKCRDYARVDVRLDSEGNPYVLEINSMTTLGRGGGYVMSAEKAGYSFEDLICRIVDVAHERYFERPAPRDPVSIDESEEDTKAIQKAAS